jgi:hypothetical protein
MPTVFTRTLAIFSMPVTGAYFDRPKGLMADMAAI